MSLIDHPENPVPYDARTGYLVTEDKVRIRYAHWPAAAVEGRQRCGTVTLLQGRAEFIEKYFEVITDLRSRGFDVVTFDWRGQGGSQRLTGNPKRGHVSSVAKYHIDLRAVLKEVSLATYPGPHFALAHSTGGLILMSDSARLRTMLDRAVITSPLLGLPADAGFTDLLGPVATLLRKLTFGLLGRKKSGRTVFRKTSSLERIGFPLARFLSAIGLARAFVPGADGTILVPFEDNRQSSDKERFERFNKVLQAAPDLGVGGPTLGWVNAVAKVMLAFRGRDAGPHMKLPALILAAGEDRIVSTPATEDFVSRTKAAAYVVIAGAAHELMMEQDVYRDQFWAAFDAFIPGQDGEQELQRSRLAS